MANRDKLIKKTEFNNFIKQFLSKGSKTNLGTPKRPKKSESETKHKIVKSGKDYQFVEIKD